MEQKMKTRVKFDHATEMGTWAAEHKMEMVLQAAEDQQAERCHPVAD